MGSVLSRAQIALQALAQLRNTYSTLHKRLQLSPGLPVANPTQPLWTYPPVHLPSEDQSGDLPDYADVVVIGSGITGTSVVYNLLSRESGLKIVMLEARGVCSGATGRNGGHINPPLYHDYEELKDKHGERVAKVMVAFRRAHLIEVQRIAEEEGILKESQVRETEHLDVFECPKTFAESKAKLEAWRAAMPVESSTFVAYERDEAIKLPAGEHELMFGGGWAQACDDGLPEIGIADDAAVNHTSQSYLAGALPQYFGLENWGAEAVVEDGGEAGEGSVKWGAGRTKAQWSGILGISADLLPWVGRVPAKLSGRTPPTSLVRPSPAQEHGSRKSGEGGGSSALAHMVLDREEEIREWFPDIMRVTEKRWKEAQFDNLIAKFM
ncbi:hypothetical protein BN946_scf184920.g21 [Trametes cinnabarina]|uniref:FAD dependent oxidoreductase domain-containing protein n=1 Tax=Pycnoporus cinnabarinus TaxID=5643 RepID=A0A060SB78_PYCCI|nr:hypothetical protein BN946_scf184920.g21 [Trametes cinnabarina]